MEINLITDASFFYDALYVSALMMGIDGVIFL